MSGAAQEDAQPNNASKFPKLQFHKWSGDINVPDPVAVGVDSQGRVYATQTKRRKVQDLDIRQHAEWIPEDIGLSSVEDKRDFFKRKLAIGGDDAGQAKHVEDWNKDGVHDWRDLTVISEVIYRLVDTDQDGTADQITTFAEDFKTEVTGVAAGVMPFAGDVYATVAPDLWKLNDHDGDGQADSQHSLVHGFGIHIAYGGHDMHGLTVGPDGKIYWSIGDKGIHVSAPDGRDFVYPHRGGVMRCNPDGSDFEVFAHGLRNVQELAFDQYGNLFSVDNDSDQEREKERFVYIVDGMDAGWRNYYQYRGDAYSPWMNERIWELPAEVEAADHPAYIVPPLGHYVDGPAGFKFNPGTALGEQYRNFFFLTSAPNGFQYAFRIEPERDAFRMADAHQIGAGYAIVGLAFDPDGGLYGADWDGGYPLDQKGSIIRIDVAESPHPLRAEVQELLAEGMAKRESADLATLLAHADQRVRMLAQFELVARQDSTLLSSVALREDASVLSRLHALWGLGQLARSSHDVLARDTLGLLMRDRDEHIRGQAAKTFGEVPGLNPTPLLRLLADSSPHVQTLAALGLARLPMPNATSLLLEQADKTPADHHYVRHGIVSALAACADSSTLAEQAKHESESRRLFCALALRKQRDVLIAAFLNDASVKVATAAARAIHDERSIAEALPKLAESLNNTKHQNEALLRRAINANFRAGTAAAAGRLLQFAQSEQRPEPLRKHAIQMLGNWLTPDVLDAVEGIHRKLPAESREIDVRQLSPAMSELLKSPVMTIRSAVLSAANKLGFTLPAQSLQEIVRDDQIDEPARVLALELLGQQWQAALDFASQSDSPALRVKALSLRGGGRQQSASVEDILETIDSDPSIAAKQHAIALLGSLQSKEAVQALRTLAARLKASKPDESLGLELLEALEANAASDTSIAKLSAELRGTGSPKFEAKRLKDFAFTRTGGDAVRGEQLFRNHVQAQCVRCHRVGEEGSNIGPPLGRIAQTRDLDYLQRAILSPSADIDPKYRTVMLLLETGEVIKGVVQHETEEVLILANSQGKIQEIEIDAIEERKPQTVSLMPEMLEVLTPREVRDLLAYLTTLR